MAHASLCMPLILSMLLCMKAQAEKAGLSYETIEKHGQEMNAIDPSSIIKKVHPAGRHTLHVAS
jgi:hypothetical protein